MPQLVRGGKHVFGWSRVGNQGRAVIPPDALAEYHLNETDKVIVLPGSRTSGGFALALSKSLSDSPIGRAVDACPGLSDFQVPEGEPVAHKERLYCWVHLREGAVTIPPATLSGYGVSIGDRLLVVRGSSLALGFAVRGPIVEEATRHSELKVFGP